MAQAAQVDDELSALIRDVIAADLLVPDSVEMRIATTVAEEGLGRLDPGDRRIWETQLLPILSKPLSAQIAIASIIRRGGYVPRKIES